MLLEVLRVVLSPDNGVDDTTSLLLTSSLSGKVFPDCLIDAWAAADAKTASNRHRDGAPYRENEEEHPVEEIKEVVASEATSRADLGPQLYVGPVEKGGVTEENQRHLANQNDHCCTLNIRLEACHGP